MSKKLTFRQAREIKVRLSLGHRGCDIAPDYGVSRAVLSSIKLGRTWGHIDL